MSWTLIESQTLGASAASVTLGSGGTIPQTYKTLKLVMSTRSDRAYSAEVPYVKPNGLTTNLLFRSVTGNGSTASSSNNTNPSAGITDGNTATASTFGSQVIDFPNYAGSTNKPYTSDSVNENNATESYQDLSAILWSSTAAITSLVIAPGIGTNWLSGSTFTLYGLK